MISIVFTMLIDAPVAPETASPCALTEITESWRTSEGEQTTVSGYRADGKKTFSARSRVGQPGELVHFTEWTYDAQGRETRERTDGPDDSDDTLTTTTWDDANHTVTTSVDRGGDGILESSTSVSWNLDGNARPVSMVETDELSGELLAEATFDWSVDSRSVASTFTRGVAAWRVTTTFDAAGNIVSEHSDFDLDGAADTIQSFVYDTDGRPVWAGFDADADGTWDVTTDATYSSNRLVARYDLDGDGSTDRTVGMLHDQDGLMIGYRDDADGDRRADITMTSTAACVD